MLHNIFICAQAINPTLDDVGLHAMVIQCFDPQIFHDSFNDIVQEL
jgi:hypothetical protein